MPDTHRTVLRPAEPRDVPAIVGLIRELAVFERLEDRVRTTPERLRAHLFGERPVVEALVVEAAAAGNAPPADAPDGETPRADAPVVVGFALFFVNYSTFLSTPGLYLEDLYVQPAHRGAGLGEALLRRLASIAVERGYGRFEWSVLDWNEGAIRFYERMGAVRMTDWTVCRVDGEALERLAGSPPPAS